MPNDELRKYVNLVEKAIDQKPSTHSNKMRSKKLKALAEAQKLVRLIENNDITEEQLDEFMGAAGAAITAAGKAGIGAFRDVTQKERAAQAAKKLNVLATNLANTINQSSNPQQLLQMIGTMVRHDPNPQSSQSEMTGQ